MRAWPGAKSLWRDGTLALLGILLCLLALRGSPNQLFSRTSQQPAEIDESRAVVPPSSPKREDVSRAKVSSPNCVWPEDCPAQQRNNDRIVEQLSLRWHEPSRYFKIFAPSLRLPEGGQVFVESRCPVDRCLVTQSMDEADVLIFQNADVAREPSKELRARQIWIAYLLESPPNTFHRKFKRLHRGGHVFNWTATYRSDSDIVTPYAKFVPLDRPGRRGSPSTARLVNTALQLNKHKRGRVAWMASNCNAFNRRLEYAAQLARHIQVDVFGKCGNLTCDKNNQSACLDLINRQYKFYLAFENSNCHEYITEKLYVNAQRYNDDDHFVLPIVMGPSRSDYERLAPPGSFIHVDDFESPEKLAQYLRFLDSNTEAYSAYFEWKSLGSFIDTKFMCRVCAMAHEASRTGRSKWYESLEDWWWSTRSLDGRASQDACRELRQ